MAESYPEILRQTLLSLQEELCEAIRDISLIYREMTETYLRFKTKDDGHINALLVFGITENALVVLSLDIPEHALSSLHDGLGKEEVLRSLSAVAPLTLEARFFDELCYERLQYDSLLARCIDRYSNWDRISYHQILHARVQEKHWHLHRVDDA